MTPPAQTHAHSPDGTRGQDPCGRSEVRRDPAQRHAGLSPAGDISLQLAEGPRRYASVVSSAVLASILDYGFCWVVCQGIGPSADGGPTTAESLVPCALSVPFGDPEQQERPSPFLVRAFLAETMVGVTGFDLQPLRPEVPADVTMLVAEDEGTPRNCVVWRIAAVGLRYFVAVRLRRHSSM